MTGSSNVTVVEVGPRDGLQNERAIVSVASKVKWIELLVDAGLKRIEVGSFVSPKHVPQMATTAEVVRQLTAKPGVSYSVLVPNQRGLDTAISEGCREVALFAAASETFSLKNIGLPIRDSLARYRELATQARAAGMNVRGYISCGLGCPYEGKVSFRSVAAVLESFLEMDCFEISLGDTIGVGTPEAVNELLGQLLRSARADQLALHFHDTGGRALENIAVGLDLGIRVVDSSIAGLGGCPFAPGASGNVATEKVVDALRRLGMETGIDEEKLAAAARIVPGMLGRLSAPE